MDPEREWWIYERLLDELRSQVDRGWTHTQFFILLNAGIGGAVLAFYGEGSSALLAASVLLGGAVVGMTGIFVLRENKRYYRTLSVKRAALEEKLGLLEPIGNRDSGLLVYAIAPTKSAAEIRGILDRVDGYVKAGPRPTSVTGFVQGTLVVLVLFDLAGALALVRGWV